MDPFCLYCLASSCRELEVVGESVFESVGDPIPVLLECVVSVGCGLGGLVDSLVSEVCRPCRCCLCIVSCVVSLSLRLSKASCTLCVEEFTGSPWQ